MLILGVKLILQNNLLNMVNFSDAVKIVVVGVKLLSEILRSIFHIYFLINQMLYVNIVGVKFISFMNVIDWFFNTCKSDIAC